MIAGAITTRKTPNGTTKHAVTLPDGRTATRNSKTREYTHCVAIRITERFIDPQNPAAGKVADDSRGWGVYGWNGRLDLAQNLATSLAPSHRYSLAREVVILSI